MKKRSIVWIAALCLFGITAAATAGDAPPAAAGAGSFTLTSAAFLPGGEIPAIYTCDGEDISPPLKWSHVPAGTKSFALVMDDPDAPAGDFIHWVLFNIPASCTDLSESMSGSALPAGAIEGKNDFHRIGYGGPCPPPGNAHRYILTLFALDTILRLPPGITSARLMEAVSGHVLARTELTGKFKRSR